MSKEQSATLRKQAKTFRALATVLKDQFLCWQARVCEGLANICEDLAAILEQGGK